MKLSCDSDDEDCIQDEDVSSMDKIERLESNFDIIAVEENIEETDEFRNSFHINGRAMFSHGSFCTK